MIPAIKTHVSRKSKRAADEFSADLSATAMAGAGFSLAQIADWQPQDVSIINAVTGSDQTTMVTGSVDTPHINWADMTVALSGRDKSAKLIETRASQKFQNQASSDIVSTIAQSVGLTPQITSTGDFAGKLYKQDTVHLLIHKTYFELMNDLADREGYRWYVDGNNLVFEPKDQAGSVFSVYWCPPGTAAAYGVANVTDLQTFRNMTAAKPHSMSVHSWHHMDKKQYDGQASTDGIGDQIQIDHHHNGRNQSQVDRLASSRLKDAIRHDCNVSVKAPANLSVTARMQLQLSGTGTIYDQVYDIDSVDFDIGWGEGAEMSIECKAPKQGRS